MEKLLKKYDSNTVQNFVDNFNTSESSEINLPAHRGKTTTLVKLLVSLLSERNGEGLISFYFPENSEEDILAIISELIPNTLIDKDTIERLAGETGYSFNIVFGMEGALENLVHLMQSDIDSTHIVIDNADFLLSGTDLTKESLLEICGELNIGFTYTSNEVVKGVNIEDSNVKELMEMDTIGMNLKAIREHLGFTQQQLADKLGFKQSSISGIESGNRGDIHVGTIRKYLEAMGCEVSFEATLPNMGKVKLDLGDGVHKEEYN